MPFEIQAKNLSKTYVTSPFSRKSGKFAVRDVNLHVRHGERIGLIGPNGAGKSTLLSMLAGIGQPSSGTLEINGQVSAILTLGICLREELSGTENIRVDAMVQGINDAELGKHMGLIADFSELGTALDRPVRTYSTGMKSRLAFSMVTQLRPEILLIDETLSAGDAFFGRKAGNRLREICDGGGIVILVSHSLEAILRMCTRCLWMEDGRIIADGDPSSVVNEYLLATQSRNTKRTVPNSLVRGLQLKLSGGGLGNTLPLSEDISLQMRVNDSVTSVEVRLLRMDGLLLDRSVIAVKSQAKVEVTLPKHPMAKGHYRIEVTARRDQLTLEEGRLSFEVTDPAPPKGSVPLIACPATAEAVWCKEPSS